MMEVIFLRQAHKFISKTDKHLKAKIKAEIQHIQGNPQCGEELSSALKGIYSHHFRHAGVRYRIAYKIVDNIIVIAVGTRENFYKKL